MGRWGHDLFGHDVAIGRAVTVIKDVAQGDDNHFAHMMHNVLVVAPRGVTNFYAQEYDLFDKLQSGVDVSVYPVIRQKLDSGLGSELFEKYRAAEDHGPDDYDDMTKYLTVVFAAIMMECGATIKEDHIQHLRDLVPKIHCDEGPTSPFTDHGFRGPGKRQFLAALDHYQAGKPRSFQQPSCHNCGKVNDDIKAEGKTLERCSECRNERAAACFCDKDCQTSLWPHHRRNCGAPLGNGTAVVKSYGKNNIGIIDYDGANV